MEDLRKEIKKKFDLLNPTQLGLIGYWFKCHNDNDLHYRARDNEYLKRIKEILKGVKNDQK
jgi:hypothetical protein|tara:strand:- start:1021 stop:1203 length:183 start_codon:yes stop_codon:yes gene_type:complete